MIKTAFKILIVALFIVLSVYFFKHKTELKVWGNYTPVIFNNNEDSLRAITLLENIGIKEIVSYDSVSVPVNKYIDVEDRKVTEVLDGLDSSDYRLDPFIKNIKNLFETEDSKDKVIYIKMESKDFLGLYKIYKVFSDNAISFQIASPDFLRSIFNYISFLLILFLFALGSKIRFLASVFAGFVAFFFMVPESLFSYIAFTLSYFIIIMLIESLAFTNQYIRRNNIGIVRILFVVFLFILPTLIPSFINYSKTIYTPVFQENDTYSYESLEKQYNENSPNISNFFTHFAFQSSFLYGYKYLFPTYEKSVTINEFKRDGSSLIKSEKIIDIYDEKYLEKFLDYCSTNTLGRFYLDFGSPFKLEFNSLISLYIFENEYMQVGILAMFMFLSSLFFKKNREKTR